MGRVRAGGNERAVDCDTARSASSEGDAISIARINIQCSAKNILAQRCCLFANLKVVVAPAEELDSGGPSPSTLLPTHEGLLHEQEHWRWTGGWFGFGSAVARRVRPGRW